METVKDKSRLRAMLRQRCPRCKEGKIFQNSLDTYKSCPNCNMLFDREPGYFMGAMYFSYALALVVAGFFLLIWYLILPDLDLWYLSLLAGFSFLPLVPMLYRYSRVVWIYFDQWAWPDEE